MPPVKFAVAIKSCHRYADRAAAQRDTWLKDLEVDYFHLVGICPPGTRPAPADPHTLACDVSDAFEQIAPKVWCACRYALESSLQSLFICDDDTFLNPIRLAQAATRRDYVGFVRTSGFGIAPHIPYIQGSAYWLGERAMEHIVRAVEIMQPGVIDDGAVGRVLDGKASLVHDRRYWPGPYCEQVPMQGNTLISTHKALPAKMKELHAYWKGLGGYEK